MNLLDFFTIFHSFLNVTGKEKEHGRTRTRTQGPSLTVRAPLSYRTTWSARYNSPCFNRFVPESAQNHGGNNETVSLLLAAGAWTHTEPPNVTGKEKECGPNGTRTQGLSLTMRAPLSYRAAWVARFIQIPLKFVNTKTRLFAQLTIM